MSNYLDLDGLKTVLSQINSYFIKKNEVINNLNSTSTTLPLSANQGKVLYDSIISLQQTASGAMKYAGVSTSIPTSAGATVSGWTTWTKGDVVTCSSNYKEYILVGDTNTAANWKELGDESSFASKSTKIYAGEGLATAADQTPATTDTAGHLSSWTSSVKNGSFTIGDGGTLYHVTRLTAGSTSASAGNQISVLKFDKFGHLIANPTVAAITTPGNGALYIKGNSTTAATFTANSSSNVNLNFAVGTGSPLTITGGSNAITISHNAKASGTIKSSASTNTFLTSLTVDSYGHVSATGTQTLSTATTSTLGLVKASDISSTSGTTYYVAVDSNGVMYTKVATVNNGTLTIKGNSTTAGSFGANQSTNTNINVIGTAASGSVGAVTVTGASGSITVSTTATKDGSIATTDINSACTSVFGS